jgi:ATP synthase protein I
MPDPEPKPAFPPSTNHLLRQVELRAARMARRGRWQYSSGWRAVATIGLIGWTVVLPMLAGIAVGSWIDRRWPSRFSWTLMLLVGGLLLGCVSAWNRIRDAQEGR